MLDRGLSRLNLCRPRKERLALHECLGPLPDRPRRSNIPLTHDVVKKVFKAIAEVVFLMRALDAASDVTDVISVGVNNVRAQIGKHPRLVSSTRSRIIKAATVNAMQTC